MDIKDFNRRWLAAWTAKDVPALLAFYAEDCLYKDNNTAAGITGQAALRGYLEGLFGATPPMTYRPESVWAIDGGFCGWWDCFFEIDGAKQGLRGFDLVLLDGDKIKRNEVWAHPRSPHAERSELYIALDVLLRPEAHGLAVREANSILLVDLEIYEDPRQGQGSWLFANEASAVQAFSNSLESWNGEIALLPKIRAAAVPLAEAMARNGFGAVA